MSNFTFLNEDCMNHTNGLPSYPDKFFELAICDPPYGIGASKTTSPGGILSCWNKYKETKWDDNIPTETYFNELKRISKNQIIWGCNYYPKYWGSGRIVWDKENGESTQSDCELAYQSFTHSTRIFRYRWYGMLQEDMKDKETRIHPTQKPIALYKWLLTKYAKPGDKILDTHVGSASSIIACLDLGFDVWGYELDKDYYRDACKRIADFQSQLKIF